MKSTSTILITSVLMTLVGCSAYVAPTSRTSSVADGTGSKNENAVSIDSDESSSEAVDDNGANTGSEKKPGNTDGQDADGSNDTGDSESSADEGEILGTIESEETADFSFEGKSVYAVWMDTGSFRSLSITIADSEVRDTSFRDVSEYECHDCDGDDDPNCNVESGETPNSILMSFSPPFVENPDHLVDENAYPIQDEMILTGDYTADANVGMSLFNSQDAAATGHAGGITFTQRPASVGEEFSGDVDITWGDGSTYKSTITGLVLESPEYPEAPECDVGNGQYLKAIYAE
jgi:hypothetical protein